MRGFVLWGVCVCCLLGPVGAPPARAFDHPSGSGDVSGPQRPATEQLGQVVGSFTFPDPPVQPYHNVVGIADDGHGHLYCADLTVSQLFLVNPTEPIAQLVDGPFDVHAHTQSPVGITTDGAQVYVGDVSAVTGADIDVYDLDGGYLRSFSVASQTGFPEGVAFNPITRHLYVVDGQGGNKVSEFTLDGSFVQNFPLNGSSQDGMAFDRQRCSYWVYDGGPSGTNTVRHYDLDFVEMETFPGPAFADWGHGDGLAVSGDRLYITTMVGGAVATVVVFDIADAMSTAGCDIFVDGFESGDVSAWSGAVP